MPKLLAPAAVLLALAVAGCDNAPNNEPAATVNKDLDGSKSFTINVPDELTPAIDAIQNPEATFNDLRNRAATMSEQAKQDAVVGARQAAEAGARALGQTEAQIQEAGLNAERSAREALGLAN